MWTNVFKIVCIFNDFFLTFFFSSVIIYYRMLSRGSQLMNCLLLSSAKDSSGFVPG